MGADTRSRAAGRIWMRRALTFVEVPTGFLLLALLFGIVAFYGWLTVSSSYIVLVSVLGITNQPAANPEMKISLNSKAPGLNHLGRLSSVALRSFVYHHILIQGLASAVTSKISEQRFLLPVDTLLLQLYNCSFTCRYHKEADAAQYGRRRKDC